MITRTQTIFAIVATIIGALAIWVPALPLGVPGEWEWQRHAGFQAATDLLDRLFRVLLGALPFWGIAVAGHRRIVSASKLQTVGLYGLLIVMSWFWLGQIQQAVPPVHRSLKPYWVLYDPSSSGYFHEAVFEIDDTERFLGSYEARMKERDVLHVGTHPPGLFLLCRWCVTTCRTSPGLVSLLRSIRDPDVEEAFRAVEQEAMLSRPLSEPELAALQLLSLLTSFAVALTLVPVSASAWFLAGPRRAWWSGCLWITFPCLAVFFPKSDLLFPLTSAAFVALALFAYRFHGWQRWGWAAAAGVVLWLGLMMSLAHLPVLVMVTLLACFQTIARSCRRTDLTPRALFSLLMADLSVPVAAVISTVFLAVLWSLYADCNLFSVWLWNFRNHADFYREYSRTWWKWLVVNSAEITLAVGPAVMILFAIRVRSSLGTVLRWKADGSDPSVAAEDEFVNGQATSLLRNSFVVSSAVTLMLLWLSGKNQGEAARLWCFLTPWIAVSLGCGETSAKVPASSDRDWFPVLFAVQILYATAAVSRVSGFSF